jgi:adenosylcobinamide kinase / adenosylcobinamide-phosphate guanylyltransferase
MLVHDGRDHGSANGRHHGAVSRLSLSAMLGRSKHRRAYMASHITLVTGGASSGKSDVALNLVSTAGRRVFVATAEAGDLEMAERIQRHQNRRGPAWDVAEVPVELASWFTSESGRYDSIVLDCLTLWLSNLDQRGLAPSEKELSDAVGAVLSAMRKTLAHVVIVTNELGAGVVPVDAVSRRFRERAGLVNQWCAREADEVYLVVSGLPVAIKPAAVGKRSGPS